MPKAIEPNSYVVLEYSLRDDDGDLLDASDVEDGEPIEYVHGYGMLVPGLEAALAGLKVGDEREVVVPASSGYGERDEELVLEIDRTELPDPSKVEIGDELVAESPDGDEIAMEVVEVKSESVVVDANHPLAGMTLHYKIKVHTVREATDEEVQKAAAELEEAHVHGEDCDHDHAETPDVVTIGKGKKKPDLLN
jgi:FKBP-type peptidyl-prolyl cis-trans isomerase SlyD